MSLVDFTVTNASEALTTVFQIVKKFEAKNHFIDTERCHNSVRNYRNLHINIPKMKQVTYGTNA